MHIGKLFYGGFVRLRSKSHCTDYIWANIIFCGNQRSGRFQTWLTVHPINDVLLDSCLCVHYVLDKKVYSILSYDVASGSEITPCIKIDKPLVVYRFTGNVMTSIITLRKKWQHLDVFTPRMCFCKYFKVM